MAIEAPQKPRVTPAGSRPALLARPRCSLAVAGVLLAVVAGMGWKVARHPSGTSLDLFVQAHLVIAYDRFGNALDGWLNGMSLVLAGAVALLAGWLLVRRRWRDAAFVVGSVGVTMLAVDGVKHLVGRRTWQFGTLAFPSGHEAVLTVLLLSGVLLAWRAPGPPRRPRRVLVSVLAVVLPIGLAIGMIGLRWHYPTDVVAGAALGAAATLVCAYLADVAGRRLLSRRAGTTRSAPQPQRRRAWRPDGSVRAPGR